MSDTELSPKSKPEAMRRIEVFTGVGRRRRWTADEKAQIIAESCERGFRPNTVHLRIRIAFLTLIDGRRLSVRRRSGKLLIFRLTQRLLRRCRRDGRRSCSISSSTVS